jgi:hypothetical protein
MRDKESQKKFFAKARNEFLHPEVLAASCGGPRRTGRKPHARAPASILRMTAKFGVKPPHRRAQRTIQLFLSHLPIASPCSAMMQTFASLQNGRDHARAHRELTLRHSVILNSAGFSGFNY